MSKLLAAFAALALAAPVLAAEPEAIPAPVAKDPPPPPAFSPSKADPILGRMGLSEEQAKKLDEALTEWGKKMSGFVKEMQEQFKDKAPDQEARAKFMEKQKELLADRDKKVRELLSAELQAKFDAGKKLMEELNEKLNEKLKKAQEEMQAAMKEAAGDAAKVKEQIKGFRDKVKAEMEQLNKTLDEKLGKMPEPPKPPAEKPKAGE